MKVKVHVRIDGREAGERCTGFGGGVDGENQHIHGAEGRGGRCTYLKEQQQQERKSSVGALSWGLGMTVRQLR